MSVSPVILLLVLVNFAAVGLLPVVFFRPGGRLNVRWWLTAAPFFVVPGFLVATAAGAAGVGGMTRALELAAVPLAGGSIAMVAYAVRAHQARIALWHQDGDAPVQVVTWGPYRWVRHPFYSAFLLALAGAAALCPHPVTLAALAYGGVALHLTAVREERRLCASALGADYRVYMQRTGRFWPRPG